MAAFYYSLKDTPGGKQFYIRFNEMTRNLDIHNAHDYPYWNFYTALFNLKITPRLDFSKVHVKYIEGRRHLEMKLDNIVLYRGSRTDYLKKNENATFQFKQFTSFSSDLTIATGYAPEGLPNETSPTIFMIQGNNVPARSIQEYSMYPHESEYLIDPISQFQIVRVFKNVRLENFKANLATVYVIKYMGNP
jgi:NAD:arginine ADP-ribosyltransferase